MSEKCRLRNALVAICFKGQVFPSEHNLNREITVIIVRRSLVTLIFTAILIGAGIGLFNYMQPRQSPSEGPVDPETFKASAPNPALQRMCQLIREGKIMGGAYEGSADPETLKASGCSTAEAAKIRLLY
jgi:hypothetical protein